MPMSLVKLHGPLAEVFGDEFRMDVRSPNEAFRALNCQLPNWLEEIRHGDYFLIKELANGEFALDERTLFLGMNGCTLHIIPAAEGDSKKGVGKIVLGVGLVAASLFVPGVGALVTAGGLLHASALAVGGLALGLSLVFGGAAMLLSPVPKLDNKDSKNDNSFLFGGDYNTVGQGMAVPITYGRDRVRALPIATMITTEQLRLGVGATYDNNGTGGDSVTYPTVVPANGDGWNGGSYQSAYIPGFGDKLTDAANYKYVAPDAYSMGGA